MLLRAGIAWGAVLVFTCALREEFGWWTWKTTAYGRLSSRMNAGRATHAAGLRRPPDSRTQRGAIWKKWDRAGLPEMRSFN
jgi:hypothetical protein